MTWSYFYCKITLYFWIILDRSILRSFYDLLAIQKSSFVLSVISTFSKPSCGVENSFGNSEKIKILYAVLKRVVRVAIVRVFVEYVWSECTAERR